MGYACKGGVYSNPDCSDCKLILCLLSPWVTLLIRGFLEKISNCFYFIFSRADTKVADIVYRISEKVKKVFLCFLLFYSI